MYTILRQLRVLRSTILIVANGSFWGRMKYVTEWITAKIVLNAKKDKALREEWG